MYTFNVKSAQLCVGLMQTINVVYAHVQVCDAVKFKLKDSKGCQKRVQERKKKEEIATTNWTFIHASKKTAPWLGKAQTRLRTCICWLQRKHLKAV